MIRYVPRPATPPSSATSALELLVETARLWRSLGHHDPQGRFRIDGVTGPDEYSAIADNNVYTNLMAQRNLRGRCRRRRAPSGQRAPRSGVDAEETAAWRDAADADVHPVRRRRSASTRSPRASREHQIWDFARTPPDQYPLLLHFPYFDLYRKQVVKQPDLVLAHAPLRRRLHAEQKARNFDYYERSPSATPRCPRAPRR